MSGLNGSAPMRRYADQRTPHVRRIPMRGLRPIDAYRALKGTSDSVLFESAEKTPCSLETAFSYICVDCLERIEIHGHRVRIVRGAEIVMDEERTDPMTVLRDALVGWNRRPGLPPFSGGLLGYFGFEASALFEPRIGLSDAKAPGLPAPDVVQLVCERLVVFDHKADEIVLVANAPFGSVLEERSAIRWTYTIEDKLASIDDADAAMRPLAGGCRAQDHTATGEASFTQSDFEAGVRRIQNYIIDGDVMQVVLARAYSRPTGMAPLDFYESLQAINPSPYAYHLDLNDLTIVGASPEMLVRSRGGRLESRPMAGTRRRGQTPDEDRLLSEELLADEKERAEHMMLIDLARNDLGRISRSGTVRVDRAMIVENYSHVMHLVSEVSGEKCRDADPIDVIAATFPAGTLSGAPKIRAIEILRQIEPRSRGVYGGCVGFIDGGGDVEQAIAIRTAVFSGNHIHLQAGAGVVMDSMPTREWQETIEKCGALEAAAQAVPA